MSKRFVFIPKYSEISEIWILSEDGFLCTFVLYHVAFLPSNMVSVTNKCTVPNLIRITQYVSELKDNNGQIVAVYPATYLPKDTSENTWMLLFITCTCQYVQVRGYNSLTIHRIFRIPQGTILGPLFFIMFINDVASNSKL